MVGGCNEGRALFDAMVKVIQGPAIEEYLHAVYGLDSGPDGGWVGVQGGGWGGMKGVAFLMPRARLFSGLYFHRLAPP